MFLAEILHGFITRDYYRTAEAHFEAGYVPPQHSIEDFAQAIRAIGEPIHNRAAEDISMAKLLTLLFEVTGLFDMRTRPELLLLQKTMVVVEGVARSLDPKLDMWSTAEPVVREWMTRHLGPAGKLENAAQGAAEVGRFVGNAPGLLSRGARVLGQLDEMTRDGLVLSPQTIAEIDKAEARRGRWTAAALWVIAALLAPDRLSGLVIALIAMQSMPDYDPDVIAGSANGQSHRPPARRQAQEAVAPARGAARPIHGRRGPSHPPCGRGRYWPRESRSV